MTKLLMSTRINTEYAHYCVNDVYKTSPQMIHFPIAMEQ